jgi:ubiquinone/menaquinone biosynthesis C-methylase UbiE
MPFQDFKNPLTAREWDADTVRYNPSRPQQLDMLLTILAEVIQPGHTVLDLGIGSGQVEALLFERLPQIEVVGVDASAAMMTLAQERLSAHTAQITYVEHDLTQIESLSLPTRDYGVCYSVQTLHHLTDAQMQTVYAWLHKLLVPGGWVLLLDRMALDDATLYAVYQALWSRLDALTGSIVHRHEGSTYADHVRIEQERGDIPLTVGRHLELLRQAGFAASAVDVQTNRALLVARKALTG